MANWLWSSVIVLPVVSLLTIACGLLTLLSVAWDSTGRFAHGVAQVWGRVILAVSRVRLDVRGAERLVPAGTYVFVANHQSLYDIPVVFWGLPYQLRIIAKDSLGPVPFIGWHLRRTGHLLVDRRNPDRSGILTRWRGLVAQHLSLIIFPEGTRSADGRIARFKAGSFLLAIQAGIPVVPVAIIGTRAVMPKGAMAMRPGRVELSILESVRTDTGEWSPTIDDARRLAARVQAIVSAEVEARQRAGAS
jgi:1-acyl-sn-glycerol-3-phosphate acyltransferase